MMHGIRWSPSSVALCAGRRPPFPVPSALSMRLIAILCCFAYVGAVTVKVGSTNVVGTTNPSLNQDAFRGEP
jgi:hypothetical protein